MPDVPDPTLYAIPFFIGSLLLEWWFLGRARRADVVGYQDGRDTWASLAIHTYNPLRIGFHEYAAIGRDVAAAKSLGDAMGYVFRPPGRAPRRADAAQRAGS